MTLALVLALTVVAVATSPLLVRILDRQAGWPLAAIWLTAALLLGRQLPDIIAGHQLSFSILWARDFLAPGIHIIFSLRADALGTFFALLTLIIGAIVLIYSTSYLPQRTGTTSFYTLMAAFTLAMLLLVLADDIFIFFLAWELVSIASFFLIARSGSAGEQGSLRTFIVTFGGGLTLLAGLSIAATAAGSTRLDDILAADLWQQRPGLATAIASLIAISAFTKSAQFPFHFWLPEAMAAATPVSAFLHAAAVVKAGIYLLLRFSTIFHDLAVWHWLLIVVGMGTAIMAAAFAIQQTDLKKLTAYSTVSHLGWVVATIGIGTPVAMAAAVVHTGAHALFKSSLFMLIGVIDHQTGTRDLRRLGRLWQPMPWTFAGAVLSVLSMAAVPPMLGFLSKEGMLTAFATAPIGSAGVALLLFAGTIGALLTFLYSAKYLFGAFLDGPQEVSKVTEAPLRLWLPAALPGAFSLPLGMTAGKANGFLEAITQSVGLASKSHLGLWHGWSLPLAISMVVLLSGVALLFARRRLFSLTESRSWLPFDGASALSALQCALSQFGHALALMAASFNPSRHVSWLFGLIALLGGATLAFSQGIDGIPMADPVPGIEHLGDLLPGLAITISVIGLVLAKTRLTAAMFVGAAGVGVSWQILRLGAPDVALTQFLVEALVAIFLMLVLRHMPNPFPPVSRQRTLWSSIFALIMGGIAFLGVWTLLGRHERSELAMWYLNHGYEITGGSNVVNTIIVEFRGFDTMGEMAVLAMAAIVISAITSSIERSPLESGTHPHPFSQSRLNALPLRQLLRLVLPILVVFSLVVFWRGHTQPGGGFIAALILAGGIVLTYLAQHTDGPVVGKKIPPLLTGVGILIAIFAGGLGLTHGSFLTAIHGEFLGQHLTTSMIFDAGISLAVLGMTTMSINALGGYMRPGALQRAESTHSPNNSPTAPTLSSPLETDPDYPGPSAPNPDNAKDKAQ